MAKTKVTLSVDEELLREARTNTVRRKVSLSSAFETLLKSFTKYELEDLAKKLGIKIRYVSIDDIVKLRGKGANAAEAVRSMRDARAKSVLGH